MGVGEQRVRIIAGTMRGRVLRAPKGLTTRPTTDRVRESLFSAALSIAGPRFGDGAVLDPFAGSGALGLEALSRGASRVVFAEKDRAALVALTANIESLGVAPCVSVHRSDAFALASRGVLRGPFSLILLDPPYTLDPTKVIELLESLARTHALIPGALCTWEHSTGSDPQWPEGFELLQRKKYGSTEIDFAVYETGTGES